MASNQTRKSAVRKKYDETVHEYEQLRFGTTGGKFFDRLEKAYVLRFLTGHLVLQVGTATGRFTQLLPDVGFHYVGIEISGPMAKTSHDRTHGLDREVIIGDGECLPFQAGSFDNVLCVRSFHFLPNPRTFLREAVRVLRDSGRVTVSFETFTPGRQIVESLGIFPKPLPVRTFYRVQEVARMFESCGLRVLWSGKVTRLPLMAYFRSAGLPATAIKAVHDHLPTWFGTVGLVTGMLE